MNNHEIELQQLWNRMDQKLDKIIVFNQERMEELTRARSAAILKKARPAKYLGILIGIPYTLLTDLFFITGWISGNIFFTVSMAFISLCTKISIGVYIYHLVLMRQISLADSVVEMQKKMVRVKTSGIQALRIVILQLPFWTTWYLNIDMLKHTAPVYWTINLLITALFIYIAGWLYISIQPKNMEKKWLKWLFSDTEYISVTKALDLLEQAEK